MTIKITPVDWTTEMVRDFWSAVSESPMAKMNFARLAGARMVDLIRSRLSPEYQCLDFGAGNGEFILELMKRGYQCAAYEISEGRMKSFEAPEFANNEKFLGLVSPTQKQQFDVVFMLDVIEHIMDDEFDSALEFLSSFVNIKGKLIISTPNNENLEDSTCICPVCHHMFHRWQHVRSFDAETLAKTLENFGFNTLAIHKVDFSQNVSLEEIEQACREDEMRLGSESHLIYVGEKRV